MEAREQSKRGGKRPGSGAPYGNWNAFKHGRYSERVQALYRLMREHARNAVRGQI
jgi:hypothetical protein